MCANMNRTDGLVRRAVRPRENGAESGGSASGNANTPDDNQELHDNKDQEDNIDDGDSKETRLTLMEEVLLLGLKDKEVSFYVVNELHVPPILIIWNCHLKILEFFITLGIYM